MEFLSPLYFFFSSISSQFVVDLTAISFGAVQALTYVKMSVAKAKWSRQSVTLMLLHEE